MHLLERIDSWSVTRPERAAHISGDAVLTYQQLTSQSNQLAHYLLNNLPHDRAPIALVGHKQSEMLIGFLGCLKAGHSYIPLDASLPAQRIEAIVQTANATLLTVDELKAILPGVKLPENFTACPLEPDDAWYIIFTSGSTGTPKGVTITRHNLENFIEWILAEQKFEEAQEIFLNQAPFSFDLSVMDLYSSLATGGTLFSLEKEEMVEPKKLYAALAKSQLTVWVSTPSFARLCLMDPHFNESLLPQVRKFWFCGETLAPEIAALLLERFPKAEVWNTYGPTEATVATTSIQITNEVIEKYRPLPVGRAKPGTRVEIHTPEGKPAPGGERGEMIIAGENVSVGYFNQAELSSKAFFQMDGQRAYHTGDWGHIRDGLIFFDGRMDFQIKLNGYRIEIGDIEANLHALPNVRDAVVLLTLKNERADYLTAFVILKDPGAQTDFELMRAMKKQLGERLPEYMLPRKFIFLSGFPTTPNGKVDRKKLAETLA
ncbi:MAG: D-alanine--poly(phosphoribitol) ligase subunit DltA [Anaerolineales bacterium]|nr:D-alanine--poly(phosphoribitol) ligase subunit DltA [Anaerolineales bacterium]